MQAGVDCLEHCYTLDDEAVAMFGERETYLAPTLGVNHSEAFFREQGWSEQRLQQMTEDGTLHRESFLRAVRAGAKPVVGTDMLPTDKPDLVDWIAQQLGEGIPAATITQTLLA